MALKDELMDLEQEVVEVGCRACMLYCFTKSG